MNKTFLKKAGTVLNIRNDKIQMFNKGADITLSGNGHYAISILTDESYFDDIKDIFIFEQYRNGNSKLKKIFNLHKKFRHPSANNLENLFKRIGTSVSDEIDINKVVTHCSTCKPYKKPLPQPIVGLSKAIDFNDIVAMDLRQLRERFRYLHFIVEFSNATIIKNKDPNLLIKMNLKNTISLFVSLKIYLVVMVENLFQWTLLVFVKTLTLKKKQLHQKNHGAMVFVNVIMP